MATSNLRLAFEQPIYELEARLEKLESVPEKSPEARDEILAEASELAKKKALANGALPESLEILSIDEIPIPYMAEETVRIHARAVGDMNI